ncbi:hypothetical protein PFISCL1PPCAC_6495, partial [Pristionchus fissidentatus]
MAARVDQETTSSDHRLLDSCRVRTERESGRREKRSANILPIYISSIGVVRSSPNAQSLGSTGRLSIDDHLVDYSHLHWKSDQERELRVGHTSGKEGSDDETPTI